MSTLSSAQRPTILSELSETSYDLIIIGGGITGAGIALDAASRGLKTFLIEKNDYASGTSSRSTKLIHGGLRYLKQFHFKEVAEVGRERKILYKNASHLVFPEKMLLPFYAKGTFGPILTSLALWVYDLLAGVKSEERRKMLNAEKAAAAEPLLNKSNLLGAGIYYEYRCDDWKLVFGVLKKAVSLGAHALNYCEAKKFVLEKNRIVGLVFEDRLSKKEITCRAKVVVNASGPWADSLMNLDNSKKKTLLHPTKGIHIVLHKKDFPLQQAAYFDTPDQRMIFAIPRKNKIYIGTTDTTFTGDMDQLFVKANEVDYLLDAVNRVFTSLNLKREHVVSSWAGIRPLIQEHGKSPSEISRKDEVLFSSHGLITIAGGKLTGYRKMAEKITDLVLKKISRPYVKCKTENLPLDPEQKTSPLSIHEKVKEAVLEEGAVHLLDYFIRRTGMLYFEREMIESIQELVANEMQILLHWTEEEKQLQLSSLALEVKNAIDFK